MERLNCSPNLAIIDHYNYISEKIDKVATISQIVISYVVPDSAVPYCEEIQEKVYEALARSLYHDHKVIYLKIDGVLNHWLAEANPDNFSKLAVSCLDDLLFSLGKVLIVLDFQRWDDCSIFALRCEFSSFLFSKVLIGKTSGTLSREREDALRDRYAPDILKYPKITEMIRRELPLSTQESSVRDNLNGQITHFFSRESKILDHAESHHFDFIALDDRQLHHLGNKYIYVDPRALLTRACVLDALFHNAPVEAFWTRFNDYESHSYDHSLNRYKHLSFSREFPLIECDTMDDSDD